MYHGTMNIPPYWVRKEQRIGDYTCRLTGFSHSSMQAAWKMLQQHADIMQKFFATVPTEASAQRMRAALRKLRGQDGDTYEACLLEPVWRAVDAANVITRNRYGALVVNSTDTCFADVDTAPASLWEMVKGLFGAGTPPERRLLNVMRQIHAEQPKLSMRLYRTAKGWRVLLSGEGIELDSSLVDTLFHRLHVDPLYRNLCRKQACWRARLTPKPWRLHLPRCPQAECSEDAASVQAEWVREYEDACEGRAVCRLVESFGPRLQGGIPELHDELTGVHLHRDTLA